MANVESMIPMITGLSGLLSLDKASASRKSISEPDSELELFSAHCLLKSLSFGRSLRLNEIP